MRQEAKQMIRPLGDVFNRVSVENLRNEGVKGVIPIGMSKEDLISRAKIKGYLVHDFDLGLVLETGVILVRSGDRSVGLYTKREDSDKVVYVLDDEFETFKDLFLDGMEG